MTKTKERILLAAQKCFYQAGASATTMQNIAETAGMARSSLYRHFRDIDDILVSIAIKVWTQSISRQAEDAIDISDPSKKWCRFIAGIATMSYEELGIDAIHSEDTLLHLVRLFYRDSENSRREANKALLPFIDAAKAKQELRNDLDSSRIAEWLGRQAWALASLPFSGKWKDDELENYIATFVLPSLLNPKLLANDDSLAGERLIGEIQHLSDAICRLEARLDKTHAA